MEEHESLSAGAGAGGPVGSLDRRIEALEKLYAMGGSSEEEEQRAGRRADLLAKVQGAKQRAEREAAETGDSRRAAALEDLERHMSEKMGPEDAPE